MGRKKINIREIENSRQRTVTFARRRAGLIKKAHELSVLCGVKVAMVIFDAKNASHVYASSGAPEDLFARYLNKQFLTNESRKRKDHAEGDEEDSGGGTYGFDGNGSFIRRRLAVVNEYKVTSDGPSSENLHVKYTKQYHNPCAAPAKQDPVVKHHQQRQVAHHPGLPPPQPPFAPHHVPHPAFASLQVNGIGLLGNPADAAPGDAGAVLDGLSMKRPLPVRSISLLKRGSAAHADSPNPGMASFLQQHPQQQHHSCDSTPMQHPHRIVSAIEFGQASGPQNGALVGGSAALTTKSADNLILATRDLSTLSLLSDSGDSADMHGYMGDISGANTSSFDINCVRNMLGIINTNKPCDQSSQGSSSGGTRSRSSSGADEPKAKRPKSHSFSICEAPYMPATATTATGAASYSLTIPAKAPAPPEPAPLPPPMTGSEMAGALSRSLVEHFLADADVAELLKTTWQGDSSAKQEQPQHHGQGTEGSIGNRNSTCSVSSNNLEADIGLFSQFNPAAAAAVSDDYEMDAAECHQQDMEYCGDIADGDTYVGDGNDEEMGDVDDEDDDDDDDNEDEDDDDDDNNTGHYNGNGEVSGECKDGANDRSATRRDSGRVSARLVDANCAAEGNKEVRSRAGGLVLDTTGSAEKPRDSNAQQHQHQHQHQQQRPNDTFEIENSSQFSASIPIQLPLNRPGGVGHGDNGRQTMIRTLQGLNIIPGQSIFDPANAFSTHDAARDEYAQLFASSGLHGMAAPDASGGGTISRSISSNAPQPVHAVSAPQQQQPQPQPQLPAAFGFGALGSVSGGYLMDSRHLILPEHSDGRSVSTQSCSFPPDIAFAVHDGKVF